MPREEAWRTGNHASLEREKECSNCQQAKPCRPYYDGAIPWPKSPVFWMCAICIKKRIFYVPAFSGFSGETEK